MHSKTQNNMKGYLSSLEIARHNINNKKARAMLLTVLSCILCFVLFLSSFLIYSLKSGMSSLYNRLGADIIVVPEGYDAKITSAILRGEPNTFFFERSVYERVKKIPGVEKATFQLFLATLSAGCCSFPIQVIGYDDNSDFLVKPWLMRQVKLPLNKGEIIVGANIVGDIHQNVKFFNQEFKIKGRLSKTGMGFDNTVFMSFDEVLRLSKEYAKILDLPMENQENLISSVMIKVDQKTDVESVKNALDKEFKGEGIYFLAAQSIMNEIGKHTQNLLGFIYILIALVWVLVFAVLILVYSVSIRERKKEIATLRIIGATKRKVKSIILNEVLLINIKGSLIGTVLSLAVSILFSNAFSEAFKMPFLSPDYILMFVLGVIVVFIGTVMGPLAVSVALNKMLNQEIALLLREND